MSSFGFGPNPLCIGQQLCHNAVGTLSEPIISGAKLSIVGRVFNRIVYTDNLDLCKLLADDGVPCPVPTTVDSLPSCYLVKPTMPANINVDMTWTATNGDNKMIYCHAQTVMAKNCP
ncbi:hypothetical protein FBU30_007835 [Linnemannia zychae]|nr:hypothetical protein FBU30_007835 [Linnemannia zychae]